MESLPYSKLLCFRPNSLRGIRKLYNLEKPGAMKTAVNLLENWIQNQNHILKSQNFSKNFLELSIIANKGSVDRAMKQIDTLCRLKASAQQFYGNYNVKNDFPHIFKHINGVALPRQTVDYKRLVFSKFYNNPLDSRTLSDFYKYCMIFIEYIGRHDYTAGVVYINDLCEVNIFDIMAKTNFRDLSQLVALCTEGYGVRVIEIHFVTQSLVIEAFTTILKQVLNPKIGQKIHVHKDFKSLYKFVPKDLLPREYGGKEKSLKELQDQWIDVLSSEEHIRYMQQINKVVADVSRTQGGRSG